MRYLLLLLAAGGTGKERRQGLGEKWDGTSSTCALRPLQAPPGAWRPQNQPGPTRMGTLEREQHPARGAQHGSPVLTRLGGTWSCLRGTSSGRSRCPPPRRSSPGVLGTQGASWGVSLGASRALFSSRRALTHPTGEPATSPDLCRRGRIHHFAHRGRAELFVIAALPAGTEEGTEQGWSSPGPSEGKGPYKGGKLPPKPSTPLLE